MSEKTQAPKPESNPKTEPNVLTKAVETIAGDNKLMNTILKVILSPLGIIAALGGLGYLLWKNSTYKDRIKELEKELNASQVKIVGLEKDLNHLGKEHQSNRYERVQEPDEEIEYRDNRLGFVPLRPLSGELARSTKRKNIYLD